MYETTNWQALGSFFAAYCHFLYESTACVDTKTWVSHRVSEVRYDIAILGANNLTLKPTDSDQFLVNMGSAAREADMDIMTQKEHTDEATSPMVLLPLEIKSQIVSYLSTQESISYLSQSCRAWHEVANEELYKRDSREKNSFAIKWMAAHAVDEQTTNSALRTLEISRRWGGQIDAVTRRHSQSRRARSQKDERIYEVSTALHFAVFLGNMRLTKTLLDMKASLEISCSKLLWISMGSEEVLRTVNYFSSVFKYLRFGSAFPIFLAFIKRDSDMCKFLVEHGASRTATNVYSHHIPEPRVVSILHFAAAHPTTHYRRWQCLFDGFGEYIDEPFPRGFKYTPLHIALINGCTEGMQIAVESGADKEARDVAGRTPLSVGVLGIEHERQANSTTIERRMMCFQKFVELGASVNPEGVSVLVLAVKSYVSHPVDHPVMRRLIYFLLDHHADIHGTLGQQNTTVLNEIIKGILYYDQDPPIQELLKELLSDLVDRGLNLTIPAPGLLSPLYRVLRCREANPEWLFDLLCEKGATIHAEEVDTAFLRWCKLPRLWRTNKYNAWWQHQGQEQEIFQKWCEHPYNAWWWQHTKRISAYAATHAYEIALSYEYRNLYDTLTHLPLPAPSDDSLVRLAFKAKQRWSWRLVVYHKFEDKSLASFSFDQGENMIHLTVRKYVAQSCYSTMDAVLAVLHLRDKGVNMSSPNSQGQTPLELLLKLGSCKNDVLDLVSLLYGNTEVFNTTISELRKMPLF